MSPTKPRIRVRSNIDRNGKRRWLVYASNGLLHLPIGWPNHRRFRTWEAAHHAADRHARNPKPRTQ